MISSEEELKRNKIFMLKNKHNHEDKLYNRGTDLLIFNKR